MSYVEIMNSIGIVDCVELVIVVLIVGEQLLYCLTELYAYCLSDALLQVKAKKQQASELRVAEVCSVHTA